MNLPFFPRLRLLLFGARRLRSLALAALPWSCSASFFIVLLIDSTESSNLSLKFRALLSLRSQRGHRRSCDLLHAEPFPDGSFQRVVFDRREFTDGLLALCQCRRAFSLYDFYFGVR